MIYRHPAESAARIGSADGVAFYQLKTILQGVLQRGTATRIAGLAPYVAGKTGTTDSENDAWFVGFTNEVTVAVWVGYDNADGRRRTLGGGATGGSVAVPIFEPIIQAAWAHHAPRTTLRRPVARDPEIPGRDARRRRFRRRLRAILRASAGRRGAPGTLVEYLRRDARGPARSIPNTGWCRATITDGAWAARRAARRFEFFFGGGRGGFAPWGVRRRPPPAFGPNAPRPQPQPYQRPLWRGPTN